MAKETAMAKEAVKSKRIHKASYAKDKKKGGYLIRVQGPNSNMFAGREVPVSMKSGDEQLETLGSLIWTGKDQDSGENVTLYSFVAKPKEKVEAEF